jgi:hypothetical protein
MNRKAKFAAAVLALTVAVPAIFHVVRFPSRDPLADELRDYGFYPINPPSTLVEVGSLYYVSEDGLSYRAICRAVPADVADVVQISRSVQIQQDLDQKGSFTSDISVDLRSVFDGGVASDYVQKVHFSLTDITLQEIPLVSNFEIQNKLMHNSACNDAVLQMLQSDGYVCQGQEILLATAEFKLDRATQEKLKVSADLKPEVNQALKAAIKTQSDQTVVERDGSLYSGSALNYGVEVNPTCLAPPHSHFLRVLPRNRLERFINFVRYRVIEPWLPPTPDAPATIAQAAGPEMK